MHKIRLIAVRILDLFRSQRLDRRLDEELRTHLEMLQEDYAERGLPDAQAHRAARLRLGGMDQAKERCRDARGLRGLEFLRQDLFFAFRMLRRHPGVAAAVVVTLALGIAANTAVFGVVNAVLLRPLPWPQANRLVAIHAVLPDRRNDLAYADTWNRAPISWAAWRDLQRNSCFAEVGVWFSRPQILGEGRADLVDVMHASSSFLSMLGIRPGLGRLFRTDEDRAESQSVVLSRQAWQKYFGGRPDVVGRTLILAPGAESPAVVKTIVGVLASSFRFQGESPEFLLPVGIYAYAGSSETSRFLHAIGRLAPGVTPDAASAVAEPLIRRLDPPEIRTGRLVPIREDEVGEAGRPLWLMFAGAGLLLMLACSNVAGLLLGHIRTRRHEIAVRISLGAGRRRILQQLAIEHLVLAVTAGAAGLALAGWFTPAMVALAPDRLPGLETASLDFRVAAFAVCLGVATALLSGLIPAVALSSTRAAETLAEGSREATPRGRRGHLALVTSEFALALVLVVCASLFGETMMRLESQPLGFDPSGLAVADISLTQYPPPGTSPGDRVRRGKLSPEQVRNARQDYERQLLAGWIHTAGAIERLSALPGVVAVAGVGTAPFTGALGQSRVHIYGQPPDEGQNVHLQIVTEDYFRTMRMAILRGRDFSRSDREGASAAVISRELERRLFAGDAVGKRLVQGKVVYEVVGVVPNARQREFSDEELPTLYVLDRQFGSVNQFIIRTSGDPAVLLPLIRQTIRNYDPRMLITSTTTMNALLARSIAEQRFRASLSAIFGGAALVLAAIGLYGLAARHVAERRREIGVRVALGARPRDVQALVLRDTWIIVGLGVLAGLPAAYGASRLTRSLLFGVSPSAPHIFLMTFAVLAAVAIAATILPARRASRIDPMLALRE